MQVKQFTFIVAIVLLATDARTDVLVTEGTNIGVDTASDGRLATDLLGGIWIVPKDGGEASAIASGLRPASRPRWSPDDTTLAYQSNTADKSELWLHHIDNAHSQPLSLDGFSDQHPEWHPSGERLTFSSARREDGFDIWETDLDTQLSWRLTNLAGDETEPTWSEDGSALAYIHALDGQWSLMLRRHGESDEIVIRSSEPLASPAWRPDGSLISYLRQGSDGWSVWMSILSEPRLHRPLITGEDFFVAPVAWLDRQHMVYAASGHIRKRRFNSWTSINVPFRARVGQAGTLGSMEPVLRELPAADGPTNRTVIRAARLYDGIGASYRQRADIIIDGSTITEITATDTHAVQPDAIVVDLGNVTVLPGFIDAFANLSESADESLGPLLLGLGVTTLVADHPRSSELNATWSGKQTPGPRLLSACAMTALQCDDDLPWLITISGDMSAGVSQREDVQQWQERGVAVLADSWQVGLGSGASLLLGSDSRPTSPGGRRYQDIQLASGNGEITFVSGLADAMTPGVRAIWKSRVAALIAAEHTPRQRYTATPNLSAAASTLVLGSRPNELPAGIALHAEFRALIASGLTEEQALKAAGVNAAAALGLSLKVGRIAPGATADLVIVDGDPLARIADTLKIVGVVRNGRFYSVSGLIDRALAARIVE